MKKRFAAKGYVRTVLLSMLAAFTIEAVVNADEVKTAFDAGRARRAGVMAHEAAGYDWLKVPQQISKGIGRLYQLVFEPAGDL